jgi:hypothetical protein
MSRDLPAGTTLRPPEGGPRIGGERCRPADADVVSTSMSATLSAGPPAASPRGACSASSGRLPRDLRGALRAGGGPLASSHQRPWRIRDPPDVPP